MTTPLVQQFVDRLSAVRGQPHLAANMSEAAQIVAQICTQSEAACVALGDLPEPLSHAICNKLIAFGIEVLRPPYPAARLPGLLDRAHVGVGWAEFAIAATGTLVELAVDDAFRLVSSLPRTYIGIVPADQLIAELRDAAPRLRAIFEAHDQNIVASFISGPSRTGDIEMILTLGVHGPEFAHAIILEQTQLSPLEGVAPHA